MGASTTDNISEDLPLRNREYLGEYYLYTPAEERVNGLGATADKIVTEPQNNVPVPRNFTRETRTLLLDVTVG